MLPNARKVYSSAQRAVLYSSSLDLPSKSPQLPERPLDCAGVDGLRGANDTLTQVIGHAGCNQRGSCIEKDAIAFWPTFYGEDTLRDCSVFGRCFRTGKC